MIEACPICQAVPNDAEAHVRWHRENGHAPVSSSYVSRIVVGHAHSTDPRVSYLWEPHECTHGYGSCGGEATWRHNEEYLCDAHLVGSTGYLT